MYSRSSGVALVSEARFAENPALPLKDYTDFDYDPLNAIANAFAKIERTEEGAALQIVIEPRAERHVKHYRKILQALEKAKVAPRHLRYQKLHSAISREMPVGHSFPIRRRINRRKKKTKRAKPKRIKPTSSKLRKKSLRPSLARRFGSSSLLP